MSDPEQDRPPEDSVRWPIGSMLFVGTFGASHSKAGRRYHSRSWLALGLSFAAVWVSALWGKPAFSWTMALLLPVTIAYITYEMWRYISTLDELARRVQLEAMSITYLIGLTSFWVLAVLDNLAPFTINPLVFIVLEPVRGLVLALRARSYQ